MSVTIASLATRLIRVPLTRPWGPDVTELGVIETVVTDSDGATGYGFSWTPTIGAASVQALLDQEITAFAVGRPTDAAELWPALWRHLHEAGGGGITTIAMAGLDLALWDLAGRRAGTSVVDLVGRTQETAEVYGSGVNLHYPLAELVAQAERWVAAGYDAVKVKVGSPDLARDVERLAALREVLGPDRRLMIDANQRWNLDRATAALEAFTPFAPAWIEEPLRADDLPAHAELRRRTDVPIALGENVHTRYRFAEFLDAGLVDVAQPNIVRVGGITPFREIVALADGYGVQVAPHLLFELSGQLALTLPRPTLVEDVEDATFSALGALSGPAPVSVDGARLSFDPVPGLGLRFA